MLRTDACNKGVKRSAGQAAKCGVVLEDVTVQGNSAGSGGGLLVTNVSSSLVVLRNCVAGSVLTEETAEACLQNNTNAVSQQHLNRSNSFRNPEEWGRAANTAAAGPMLLTSAASMGCGSIVNTDPLVIKPESCSTPVKAGKGSELRPAIFLLDGLGKPVHKNSVDSNMQVQVRSQSLNAPAIVNRTAARCAL